MVELQFASKPCLTDSSKRRIKLVSNLLPVSTLPKVLYHYNTTITPEVSRHKIVGLFFKLIKSTETCIFGNSNYAFDGINMLVTDKKLKDDLITIQAENGIQKIAMELKIQYKNEYHMNDLVDYMKGSYIGNTNTHVQCLEVILRNHEHNKYTREGSRCFNPDKYTSLTNKILMHTGLTQSLKVTSQGLHNNIDLSYYLSYASTSVIDILSEMSSRSDRSYSRSYEFDELEIARKLTKQDGLYRDTMALLKSVRLETTHRAGKAFSFRAAGLSSLSAKTIVFATDDSEMTVEQYFTQKYKKLRYPNLPCVIKKGRNDNPLYFPLECLKIARNQKYEKKLSELEVAEMIKVTAKQPAERFQTIKEHIQDMQITKNETLNKFNLTLGEDFRKCTGLAVNAPIIEYGSPNNIRITPENGSWNMKNCNAVKGTKVNNWVISYLIDTQIRNNDISTAVEALIHYGKKFGVQLNQKYTIKSVSKPSEYVHLIDTYTPDLVLFILPTHHRNDVYAKIKTISETDKRRVITQCIKSNNVRKLCEPSFASNILIKINSKLGGRNWVLSKENLVPLNNKYSIIFGADVCHSGIGEDMLDSVAAVTATMDKTFTDYSVEIQYQKKSEEIIGNLHLIVRKLLIMHYTQTKIKPARIIFFRDGVGESQYGSVMENEVAEIQKACQILDKNYKPEIIYIIAQKRHHVRFRLLDENTSLSTKRKSKGNPLPGTVVEDLSHPLVFDFYMINHNAIQGTARPVKYTVLYNEAHLSRDEIYSIIHNLCHTYARATKSVSLVTPIMYAHLAAGRAKLYLKDDKSHRPKLTEELKTTCFYN